MIEKTHKRVYIRTCQECGNKQEARWPATIKGDGWRDLKCKKCHSVSMDFGSHCIIDEARNIVRMDEVDE